MNNNVPVPEKEFNPVVALTEILDLFKEKEFDIYYLDEYRKQLIDWTSKTERHMFNMREEINLMSKDKDKLIKFIESLNSQTNIILMRWEQI